MRAERKVFTAKDLGPGDGGKGGVVHKLCIAKRAHTVLKVGGAQGSHGVCTSDGKKFAFSQFGCGTLNGVRTHITDRFVMDPSGLLHEAIALFDDCGISDSFDLLTVDENTICTTLYHGVASRLRELARKNAPRGTIGTGVGEAFQSALQYPELTIRAGDLTNPLVRMRLEAVREQMIQDLEEILRCDFDPGDREEAEENKLLLLDRDMIDAQIHRYRECARRIRIVGKEYLRDVLRRDGVVVVESSHGVLTDKYFGFAPHTSKLRTLPRFTDELLAEVEYDGQVINLGVTRAYQIRHGAGPMVTHDPSMSETLLPGSSKDENRYQGKVRVGPLDIVSLRYAIDVCGGPSAFDGLAITWFDQIQRNGVWNLCPSYPCVWNPEFFLPNGRLKVPSGEDDTQLDRQRRLTEYLKRCRPNIESHKIPSDATEQDLVQLCKSILEGYLEVPVRMISFGPTEKEKVLC